MLKRNRRRMRWVAISVTAAFGFVGLLWHVSFFPQVTYTGVNWELSACAGSLIFESPLASGASDVDAGWHFGQFRAHEAAYWLPRRDALGTRTRFIFPLWIPTLALLIATVWVWTRYSKAVDHRLCNA